MRKKWTAPAAVLAMIIVDQATKLLAVWRLRGRAPVVLVPGIFELRYLENQSAAFGMDPISILQGIFHFSYFEEHPQSLLNLKLLFFVVLTAAVCVFLFFFYRKLPESKKFCWFRCMLLMFGAGAIGNCIDRLLQRYVIDFFYFRLIDFPIFNVADIYVTVSAVVLGVLWIFFIKEDDFHE